MAQDQWYHHLSAKQVKEAKQTLYETVISKRVQKLTTSPRKGGTQKFYIVRTLDTLTMQQRSMRKLQPIPAPQARERTLFLNVEV